MSGYAAEVCDICGRAVPLYRRTVDIPGMGAVHCGMDFGLLGIARKACMRCIVSGGQFQEPENGSKDAESDLEG